MKVDFDVHTEETASRSDDLWLLGVHTTSTAEWLRMSGLVLKRVETEQTAHQGSLTFSRLGTFDAFHGAMREFLLVEKSVVVLI